MGKITLSYPSEQIFADNLNEVRGKINAERGSESLSNYQVGSDEVVLSKEEIERLFNKEGFNISGNNLSKIVNEKITVKKEDITLGSLIVLVSW